MDYFIYINSVRRPDGTLRTWEEHNLVARSEEKLENHRNVEDWYLDFKYEERKRFQNGIQKVSKIP